MTEQEAHRLLRERGRADMDEIFGKPFMARRDATTTAFNAPLRALSEEFAYATLWARPGLGRRERSLMTLAMLCALNRPHEIRLHVPAALNNGVTVEEIGEALTHAAAYCVRRPSMRWPSPSRSCATRGGCRHRLDRERGRPPPAECVDRVRPGRSPGRGGPADLASPVPGSAVASD